MVKTMQLSIKKIIDYPQRTSKLPTNAAVLFNLSNQFNSVSREEFFNVIKTSFPELLPLTKLFYHEANTVHHKWDDRTWRTLLMKEGVSQGCPLSPLFALFVVARLLELERLANKLQIQSERRMALHTKSDSRFLVES